MKPSIAALRLRTLAEVSKAASDAYGISRIRAARAALRLRRRNGFPLEEGLEEGLLDPTMDDRWRSRHIGRTTRRAAQDRLNPVSLEWFSEEKLVFYDYCRANGIPVPELYGAVGRAGGWSRRSGRIISGSEAFAAFLNEVPGDVVIKPTFGLLGEDVRVLVRASGGFTTLGGTPVEPAALYGEICAHPEYALYVVQERVRNHPEIEEIAGSPVLQTLRFTTVVRPDGTVAIVAASLKLAVGDGDTDNFHNGVTGNGFCLVSLDVGELGPLGLRPPGRYGVDLTPTVPDTGVQVEGRRIPYFEEACALVRRGSPLFLPMRTLGWDIAITPDGPVVIEANNWWAPFGPLTAEGWALLVEED